MAIKHAIKAGAKIDKTKKSHGNDPLILKRTEEIETFLKKAGLPDRFQKRTKELV